MNTDAGSAVCPICGHDMPHNHTALEARLYSDAVILSNLLKRHLPYELIYRQNEYRKIHGYVAVCPQCEACDDYSHKETCSIVQRVKMECAALDAIQTPSLKLKNVSYL